MGNLYYYLIASLPLLQFDNRPPFPYGDFLNDCQGIMSEHDFASLKKATLDCDSTEPMDDTVVQQWAVFNRELKSEQAKIRSLKAGRDSKETIRCSPSGSVALLETVIQASKSADPLEAERILDRYKWQKMEDLLQGHFFDLGALIIYGLKLQVLERYKKIKSSKGKEIFLQYKELSQPKVLE